MGEWAGSLEAMAMRAAAEPQYSSGIAGGIDGALAWLDDLALADLACPPPGTGFDIREFIRARGTVYVIARDTPNCAVSPYVACLATAIWNTAKAMAADPDEPAACGGRVDPALLMLIDEPDAGCPIPVGDWARTAGGDGVVMVTGYQSDAQPRRRDGDHAGQVLEDCFTVKLVFRGGTGNIYEKAAKWGGPQDTWVHDVTVAADGAKTKTRRHTTEPAFPPQRIGNLDEGQAFVKVNGCRAFIAHIGMVQDHPLYQKADPAGFGEAPRQPWQDAALTRALLYLALLAQVRRPLPQPTRPALEAPRREPIVTPYTAPTAGSPPAVGDLVPVPALTAEEKACPRVPLIAAR
jgi:type IV secretory pathway TraG/TraD family ATPase VirD4